MTKQPKTTTLNLREALQYVTPIGAIINVKDMALRMVEQGLKVTRHDGVEFTFTKLKHNIDQYLSSAINRGEFERLGIGQYRRLQDPSPLPTSTSRRSKAAASSAIAPPTQPPPVAAIQPAAAATSALDIEDPTVIEGFIFEVLEQQLRAKTEQVIKSAWVSASHRLNERKPDIIREMLEDLLIKTLEEPNQVEDGVEALKLVAARP